MTSINKTLLRLAVAIHAALASGPARARLADLPASAWELCVDLDRQIRRAEQRGWLLAADVLREDLRYSLQSLISELTSRQPGLAVNDRRWVTIRDLYQDLVALEAEFGNLKFDINSRSLAVTTEPIELHGVYLGPFEISLAWNRIATEAAYRVIATDPHPCASRDHVTHPHVADEALCEGEGRQAIRSALAQGRLLDFFTLVAGVLRTYNRESPYVPLAEWYGQACSDCGTATDSEDSYACQRCGETVCDDCESCCVNCENSYCSRCIRGCAICEEPYCQGCLQGCPQCDASVCTGCLVDNERCTHCHEEESEDGDRCPPAAVDGAAVQPHGLGQTAVPA
jgi:hypothetical protein